MGVQLINIQLQNLKDCDWIDRSRKPGIRQ
jgi:hypothetical protein